ncbi:hypothetical protein BDQ17DRAFT_1505958 [Cyathus striatus]|nr:hypothetical protein BDQ17DRAFT_1505958 [Cyathus striatus]
MLQQRANSSEPILLCQDLNLNGTCAEVFFNPGACVGVPTNLNDAVTSLSIPNGFVCTIFKNINCQGNNIFIIPPGANDLTIQQFNDEMSSLLCDIGECKIAE